jgi:hypothetical protein
LTLSHKLKRNKETKKLVEKEEEETAGSPRTLSGDDRLESTSSFYMNIRHPPSSSIFRWQLLYIPPAKGEEEDRSFFFLSFLEEDLCYRCNTCNTTLYNLREAALFHNQRP